MNGLTEREIKDLKRSGLAKGSVLADYLGCCSSGMGQVEAAAIAAVIGAGAQIGTAAIAAEAQRKLSREQTKQIRMQLEAQALEGKRGALVMHESMETILGAIMPLAFAGGVLYLAWLVVE